MKNIVKNSLFTEYSIFNAQNSDILIDGFGRRTYRNDKKQWDTILDPIGDSLTAYDLDWIFLERSIYEKDDFHYENIYTDSDNLVYTDIIHMLPRLIYISHVHQHSITSDTKQNISDVISRISYNLGINIENTNNIDWIATKRDIQLHLYKHIVDHVQPKALIYSSKFQTRALIEVCKSRDIPVIEVQHGILDYNHLTLNYSKGISPALSPDHFLTWGQYWSKQISDDAIKTHVIGNAYSDNQYRNSISKCKNRKRKIVVISQPFCGPQLADLAQDLSRCFDGQVIFKPHPGTEENWEEYYPQLKNTPVAVPDTTENLYDILASAQVQVSVSSTALFEGLRFNLETYILTEFTSSYFSQLINEGIVTEITTHDEIIDGIGSNAQSDYDIERWFHPYSDKKTHSIIRSIAN